VRDLLRRPEKRHVYVTYEAQRAWDVSQDTIALAKKAGIEPLGAKRRWQTSEGGGVLATGIGGPLTGYPVDGILLIDDPVKNAAEAESSVYRERAMRWFKTTAMTRVHKGASVIVVQTRWHPEDLAGQLIKDGWESVNLPAINDGSDPLRAIGEPLDPLRWPLDVLEARKRVVGDYVWASLYQGQPRPRGGKVFQDAWLTDQLPVTGYRVGIGVDLAYTRKTKSDYSVIVVLFEVDGVYYVANCIRRQVQTPEFKGVLRQVMNEFPGSMPRWYCAGTERGVADLIGGIDARNASQDKFLRAQPVSAAWNAGAIRIPRSAPWTNTFLSEVLDFTGSDDLHDDIVDALAAAYDALRASSDDYESMADASGW
jgi:predicted phage terminase large subunit-like protein